MEALPPSQKRIRLKANLVNASVVKDEDGHLIAAEGTEPIFQVGVEPVIKTPTHVLATKKLVLESHFQLCSYQSQKGGPNNRAIESVLV